MGIYRCNHCKIWGETTTSALEHQPIYWANCGQCGQKVGVYPPLEVVKQLSARYAAALREIEALNNQDDESATVEPTPSPAAHIKINETSLFATAAQHQPLENWFKKRDITVKFNYAAVDMSGYYDEAAEKIGTNYPFLKNILKQISTTYHRNALNVNLDLKKHSQKEQQQISSFCREFYSKTLFAVYNYNKKDKNLFLKLQTAKPVRQFFMGEWLEWFALNVVLHHVSAKHERFSCARNVNIRFANEDLHELDVMLLLPQGAPLIIECKTGEYRRDLDKYLTLRKRLNIPAQNFVLLVLDVDEAQAKALSGMYDLTFVTLNGLAEHLQKLM